MDNSVTSVQLSHSQYKPTLRGSENWHHDESLGAQLEEPDTLYDLLRCPLSPWYEEASWSPQALVLRELAVKAPEKLKADFIRSSLTTLRLVNKGVSQVLKSGQGALIVISTMYSWYSIQEMIRTRPKSFYFFVPLIRQKITETLESTPCDLGHEFSLQCMFLAKRQNQIKAT